MRILILMLLIPFVGYGQDCTIKTRVDGNDIVIGHDNIRFMIKRGNKTEASLYQRLQSITMDSHIDTVNASGCNFAFGFIASNNDTIYVNKRHLRFITKAPNGTANVSINNPVYSWTTKDLFEVVTANALLQDNVDIFYNSFVKNDSVFIQSILGDTLYTGRDSFPDNQQISFVDSIRTIFLEDGGFIDITDSIEFDYDNSILSLYLNGQLKQVFLPDKVNDADANPLNEAWIISDGLASKKISNQKVTFKGKGSLTAKYNIFGDTLSFEDTPQYLQKIPGTDIYILTQANDTIGFIAGNNITLENNNGVFTIGVDSIPDFIDSIYTKGDSVCFVSNGITACAQVTDVDEQDLLFKQIGASYYLDITKGDSVQFIGGNNVNLVVTPSAMVINSLDTSGYNNEFYILEDSIYIGDYGGVKYVSLKKYITGYNKALSFINDTLTLTDDSTSFSVYIPDTSGYNDTFYISNDTIFLGDAASEKFVVLPPSDSTDELQVVDTFYISNDTIYFKLSHDILKYVYFENGLSVSDDSLIYLLDKNRVYLKGGDSISIVLSGDTITFNSTLTSITDSIGLLGLVPKPTNEGFLYSDGTWIPVYDTSGIISNVYLDNDTLFIVESGVEYAIPLVDTSGYNKSLILENDTLKLTDGQSTLSIHIPDSDISGYNESFTKIGNQISITDDNSTLSVYVYDTSGYNKSFFLSGNSLSLIDDGGSISINLSKFAVDTSGYNTAFYILNNRLYIVDENSTKSVNLAPYLSGYNQQLYIQNDSLYITDDNSTLSVSLPNQYNTDFYIDGTNLYIEDGNSTLFVELPAGYDSLYYVGDQLFLSGDQSTLSTNIYKQDFQFTTINDNRERISLDNSRFDLNVSGSMSISRDGSVLYLTAKDSQVLELTADTLAISDGNFIVLDKYLDNTDEQGFVLSTISATTEKIGLERTGTAVYLKEGDNIGLQRFGETITISANVGTIFDTIYFDSLLYLVVDGDTTTIPIEINERADTSGYNYSFTRTGDSLFIQDGQSTLSVYAPIGSGVDRADTSGYNLSLTRVGDSIYIQDGSGTLSVYAPIVEGLLGSAQDIVWYVKNESGTTIPKGKVVMAVGTDGNSGHILVDEMIGNNLAYQEFILGVTTDAIDNGGFGYVMERGKISSINLTAYNNGDLLYIDPDNAGEFTDVMPDAGNLKQPIAFVVSDKSNGVLAVRVKTGEQLGQLHDVKVNGTLAVGNVIVYDGSIWKNQVQLDSQLLSFDTLTSVLSISNGNSVDLSTIGGDTTFISNITQIIGDTAQQGTRIDTIVINTIGGDTTIYIETDTNNVLYTGSNGISISGSEIQLGGTMKKPWTTFIGQSGNENMVFGNMNNLYFDNQNNYIAAKNSTAIISDNQTRFKPLYGSNYSVNLNNGTESTAAFTDGIRFTGSQFAIQSMDFYLSGLTIDSALATDYVLTMDGTQIVKKSLESDLDNQKLTVGTLTGENQIPLTIENGNQVFIPIADPDADATNEIQTLSWSAGTGGNDVITLSDGGGSITITDNVNDADASTTNEKITDVSLVGTTLNITEGGVLISENLAGLQDGTGTDDQKIDQFQIISNTLYLSLENDGEAAKTVSLSPYLDNTDDQTAAEVPFTPTGTISSTNVQAAIAELDGDISGIIAGDFGTVGNNQLAYGSADTLTSSSSLTWNNTNKTLAINENLPSGMLSIQQNGNTDLLRFQDESGNELMTVDEDGRLYLYPKGGQDETTSVQITHSSGNPQISLLTDGNNNVTISQSDGSVAAGTPNRLRFIHTGDSDKNLTYFQGGKLGVNVGSDIDQDFDVNGDARLRGALFDSTNSSGTAGQVLTSNGANAWSWETVSGVGGFGTFGDNEIAFGSSDTLTTSPTFTFSGNYNLGINYPNSLASYAVKLPVSGNTVNTGRFLEAKRAYKKYSDGLNDTTIVNHGIDGRGNYFITNKSNSTNNSTIYLGANTDSWTQGTSGTTRFTLTGGQYGLIVADSDNKVGIGALAPDKKFHVRGDSKLEGALFDSTGASGTAGQVLTSNGANAWSWEDVSGGGAESLDDLTDAFNDPVNGSLFLGTTGGSIGGTDNWNLGIGFKSLNELGDSQSDYNIAIGTNSLEKNTGADNNIAIGAYALAAKRRGSNNIAIGNGAGILPELAALTNTVNSIYIGTSTKSLIDSAVNQIVIGHYVIGKGSNTTVIGSTDTKETHLGGDLYLKGAIYDSTGAAGTAGQVLTSNGGNAWSWEDASGGGGTPTLTATYVGFGDGSNQLTGSSDFTFNDATNELKITGNLELSDNGSIFIGQDVGDYETGTRFTTAIGYKAYSNSLATGGGYNAMYGAYSGRNLFGGYNSFFGAQSGSQISSGTYNTFAGYAAGMYNESGSFVTSGSYNTLLGQDTRMLSNGDNNSIVIGSQGRGEGSNTTVIGNTSTTKTHLYGNLELDGTILDGDDDTGTSGQFLSYDGVDLDWVDAPSSSLTASYIGYGSGSNELTGESDFTYNTTNNVITLTNANAGNSVPIFYMEGTAGTSFFELKNNVSSGAGRAGFRITNNEDRSFQVFMTNSDWPTGRSASFSTRDDDNMRFVTNGGSPSGGSSVIQFVAGGNQIDPMIEVTPLNLGLGKTDPTYPVHVGQNMKLDADLIDEDGSAGTAGQVLGVGVTGVEWQNPNDLITVPSPSLTASYIGYGSGSNELTGESALIWDAANNRLGINTASPTRPIQVESGDFGQISIRSTDANRYAGFQLVNAGGLVSSISLTGSTHPNPNYFTLNSTSTPIALNIGFSGGENIIIAESTKAIINKDLELEADLIDEDGSAGTAGQVLGVGVTGVEWQNPTDIGIVEYTDVAQDGSLGATETLDMEGIASKIFEFEVGGTSSTTLTFSNPVNGGTYVVRFFGATGTFTVNFPSSVRLGNGNAVTSLTSTSGWLTVRYYYNGENYITY